MNRKFVTRLVGLVFLVVSAAPMNGQEEVELATLPLDFPVYAELVSYEGFLIGAMNIERTIPDGPSFGFLKTVDFELKPTKELSWLVHNRSELRLAHPSDRLSLDLENQTVTYSDTAHSYERPLRTKSHLFNYPEGATGPSWSTSIDSPKPLDLLIAYIPFKENIGRIILFLVFRDQPEYWQSTWVPISRGTVDYSRFNPESGFSLYREGNQLVLFLPLNEGDQAWEIHLPETIRDSVRFHVFPINDFSR
jgi:hypothetical protein